MYHGFGERTPAQDPERLFTSGPALRAQLTRLLAQGYQPLSPDGFLHGLRSGRWPRRSFLVTIDDGYVSTLDVAAPLLAGMGVPAILFALPGRVGGRSEWAAGMPDEPLLDTDGLRALPGFGVTVSCHGWDHRRMVDLDDTELRVQTTQAQEDLADLTGIVPSLFAYPFGEHDQAARRAVATAGFEAAFAVYHALDRFTLPRVSVDRGDSMFAFRVKTSPAYLRAKVAYNRSTAARRALQAVRRTALGCAPPGLVGLPEVTHLVGA